jgi:outer membrane murein-binding lipoprotein Lpp
MKSIIIITTLLLAGCATNPDVDKSVSRDRTMNDMAKTALINEMLNSKDPAVRLEGARIAKDFVIPKRSLIDVLVK